MGNGKVDVWALNNNLKIQRVASLDRVMCIDVTVAKVLQSWDMLLSRSWTTTLGGTMQMDLSYTTIHVARDQLVMLDHGLRTMFNVDLPNRELENADMLLSRSWGTTLGGTIQMDLSYTTIHVARDHLVMLDHGLRTMNNVDLPNRELENVAYVEKELGNYTIMLESEIVSSTSGCQDSSSSSK
jgi:hypothetical protein